MPGRVPQHEPRVPAEGLDRVVDLIADEDEIADIEFDGDATALDLERVSIERARFTGARCAGASFERARVTDVEFVRCDLAGVRASEAGWRRARFVDCRLAGADLSAGAFVSVAFVDCRFDDANLRHTNFDSVRFENCVFVATDIGGSTLTDVVFDGSELVRVDFDRAKCTRVDLRRARLDGVRGGNGLRGATVAPDQLVVLAPALAAALGLEVRDAEPE